MSNESRTNLSHRMKNSSYIFVPFAGDKISENFSHMDISDYWRAKEQGNKYFLKYIVDKLNHGSNEVCCRPYIMDDYIRREMGIIESNHPCFLETLKYTDGTKPFAFTISEILLFLFETNIGFLVFKIEHSMEDTLSTIASKNYHLKKVHNTILFTNKSDGTKATLVNGTDSINSLSLLSEFILEKTMDPEINVFFNHNTMTERRSNILTHVNLKLDHDLNKIDNAAIEDALFHLKRNYHSEWQTEKRSVYKEDEYFKASSHIRWGITSEATVSLTITDPKTFFVGNSFYDNFHSYYLYLYIIALHQKYALYHFLTNFSTANNLDTLEKKLKDLANFKAKYVFEIISESETYQSVYSKQCKAFGLHPLFVDIDEQVKRILEIKERKQQKVIEKQGTRMNKILGLIAFLGLFSALVDINTILDWLNIPHIGMIKVVASVIIAVIGMIFFVLYIFWGKEQKDKE